MGVRLWTRRREVGWSQTKLGAALEITFQQVQKYEKGANRMAVSTLLRAADALQVPVAYFLEDLNTDELLQAKSSANVDGSIVAYDFSVIQDAGVRKAVQQLIYALARCSETSLDD